MVARAALRRETLASNRFRGRRTVTVEHEVADRSDHRNSALHRRLRPLRGKGRKCNRKLGDIGKAVFGSLLEAPEDNVLDLTRNVRTDIADALRLAGHDQRADLRHRLA